MGSSSKGVQATQKMLKERLINTESRDKFKDWARAADLSLLFNAGAMLSA